MTQENIIIVLLACIGALILWFGGYYINSVEEKFQALKTDIQELKAVVGMRKVYGSIEHRKTA